jgi:hypothetical protein
VRQQPRDPEEGVGRVAERDVRRPSGDQRQQSAGNKTCKVVGSNLLRPILNFASRGKLLTQG